MKKIVYVVIDESVDGLPEIATAYLSLSRAERKAKGFPIASVAAVPLDIEEEEEEVAIIE